MSTVSGLASKADKDKGSKQKYSSLNINNLYKGKSLEPNKSVAPAKHGLQTLGKVGSGRRVPPPANLTSLTNDISQTKSTSNGSVSQSGLAWGDKGCTTNTTTTSSSTSINSNSVETSKASSKSGTAPSISTITSGSNSDPTSPDSSTNKSFFLQSSHSSNKVWSASNNSNKPTSSVASGGGISTNNGVQLFPEEFPSLDGGDVLPSAAVSQSTSTVPTLSSSANKTTASDQNKYGPGPSLRPQMVGNWTRGSNNMSINAGNQPPNTGSFVNGYEVSSSQGILANGSNRPYGLNNYRQYAPGQNIDSMAGGRPHHSGPRYNNNNAFHSGAGGDGGEKDIERTGRPNHHHLHHQKQQRDDTSTKSKAAILTENDLKCFDDLIDDDTLEDWTRARNQIDFNAKLNFSDDDDEPAGSSANATARRVCANDEDDEFAEANSTFLRETGRLTSSTAECQDSKPRVVKAKDSDTVKSVTRRENDNERRISTNKSAVLESSGRSVSEYSSTNKSQPDRDLEKQRELSRPPFNRDANSFGNQGNNGGNKSFQQKVLPPRFQRLQHQNSFGRSNADNIVIPRKRMEHVDSSNDPAQEAQPQRRILTRDPNWRRNDAVNEDESGDGKSLGEQFSKKIHLNSSSLQQQSAATSNLSVDAATKSVDKDEPIKEDAIGLFDRNLDWASECSAPVEIKSEVPKAPITIAAAPIQISSKQFEFVADSIQNKSGSEPKILNKNESHEVAPSISNSSDIEPKSQLPTDNLIKEDRRIRRDYSKRDEQLRNYRVTNYESKGNNSHESSTMGPELHRSQKVMDSNHVASNEQQNEHGIAPIQSHHSSIKSSEASFDSSKSNTGSISAGNQSNYISIQRPPVQRDQRRFDRSGSSHIPDAAVRGNALINSLIENSVSTSPSFGGPSNPSESNDVSNKTTVAKHVLQSAPTNSAAANLSSLSTEFNEPPPSSERNNHNNNAASNITNNSNINPNTSSSNNTSTSNSSGNNNNNNNQGLVRNPPRTYGPPPSKAAFGEQLRTHSARKNSESSDSTGKHAHPDQPPHGAASNSLIANSSSGQSSFSAISIDQNRSDKDGSRRNNNGNNRMNSSNNNRRQNTHGESYDDNMRGANMHRNRYLERNDSSGNSHSFSNDFNRSKDGQDRRPRKDSTGKDMISMKGKTNGPASSQIRRSSNQGAPNETVGSDKMSTSDFEYKNSSRKGQAASSSSASSSQGGKSSTISMDNSSKIKPIEPHNEKKMVLLGNKSRPTEAHIVAQNQQSSTPMSSHNLAGHFLNSMGNSGPTTISSNMQHTSQHPSLPVHSTHHNSQNVHQHNQSQSNSLSGCSKSSSFDQQDSGVDLSDQFASNGSSQRSSPSATGCNRKASNTGQSAISSCDAALQSSVAVPTTIAANNSLAVNSNIVNTVSDSNSIENKRTVGTVIFENRRLKAENAVLDKFGNKLIKSKDSSRNETDMQSGGSIVLGLSSPADSQSKSDLIKTNDSFGSSKAPGSGSRVVGASRAVGRNSPSLLDSTGTSNADDLNMKIASVKNVWESITSMPNVLDISGDDNLPLDHDSRKLRSPARPTSDLVNSNSVSSSGPTSIVTSANVSGSVVSSCSSGSMHSSMQHSMHQQMQQQANSAQHHLLGSSSAFMFPPMKPIGSDEQLKKSMYSMNNASPHVLAHQLAHSQQQHLSSHAAQQQQASHHHHHSQQPQAQPNQSMLISSSPPNLLNHLGAAAGSLDNRRSYAVNQFSSITNVPRISSPSGMLYNATSNQAPPPAPNQVPPPNASMNNPAAHAAAAAAHANIYQQFASQIKGMTQQSLPSAMMAQFAAAAAAQQHHSHQFAAASHHAALMQQQQQRAQPLFQQPSAQINTANPSSAGVGQQMSVNATQSQPTANAPTPDYARFNQQSMAASHLLKQHFVQAQQLQAAVAAAAAAGCPQPGTNQPPPPPPVGSSPFYAAAPPPTPAAAAAAAAQKAYYTAQASNAAGTLQHLQNAHSQQHSHLAPGQPLSGHGPSHVPQGPPPPNAAQYGNFLPTQFGLLSQAQSQMPTGQFRQSKRPNLLNQNNVSYS